MKTKLLFLLVIILLFSVKGMAQDFSNKGTDFWVGYGAHEAMYNSGGVVASGGAQNMVLYFTSDQDANVKVEIPATGWVRTYTVKANQVTETTSLPKTGTDDVRLAQEGLSKKAIHITSDKPVVAYGHIYNGAVSGAMLLFPTNTLGSDYYTLAFTQLSNSSYGYPFAFVIATEDNTLVEITPSASTQNHPAGVTFTQLLQKGEVFNLLGQQKGGSSNNFAAVDLTGTRIRSVSNGSSGCKKIAVFCGSAKINIKCDNSNSAEGSSDNIIQQCFPATAWGKKYITVPTKDMPNNFYRVMVNNSSTVVKRNGAVITNLVGGRYYEFQSNTPNIIEADNPVMVAQYITTRSQCGNNAISPDGDPEMIYLSPIEQTINKITLNSTTHAAINDNNHYLNVTMKTSGIGSFKLDGVQKTSSFVTLPGDPNYSYLSIKTTKGIHTLESDSGFNAIAYGYGNAESYGYNAGTNVKDLYQFVSLENELSTVQEPVTCVNTPFNFSITLPYIPTSISWDFGNNPNLSPNTAVTHNNPQYDSTYVKDGKTLYVYRIKNAYSFSSGGAYQLKVTVNNQTSEGCSGIQEVTYNVSVIDRPKVDFTYSQTGCAGDSTYFSNLTDGMGRTVTKWIWDLGDGTVDSVKTPLKKYTAANSYTVKLKAITDVGCYNDVSKTLVITPKPDAQFTAAAPYCLGSPVTFTDASSIASGSVTQWTWKFGEGTPLVATSNSPVTHTYNSIGKFTASLEVLSASGCKSNVFAKEINIYNAPSVSFTYSEACVSDGIVVFKNHTTINDPALSPVTYQWDFGDNSNSFNTDPAHIFSSIGPYNVKLTATASNGCSVESLQQVRLNPNPTGDFTTSNVCFGDTTELKDASQSPNIVKWHWVYGDGKTDTVQNPKHYFSSVGSNNVKLVVISDKGCASDTVFKTADVYPLPTADFTVGVIACENSPVTITDQSTVALGFVKGWNWDFGDGTSVSNSTGVPFSKTYSSPANYALKLQAVTDKGCVAQKVKTVTVNATPVANFGAPEVCVNDPYAQFNDSSFISDGTKSSLSYSWNFGDPNSGVLNPNTSTLQNPQHTYKSAGNYVVTLAVSSAKGCSSRITKFFSVNSLPTASLSVLNGGKLCSNTSVEIKDLSSVAVGSLSKIELWWDAGNSSSSVEVYQNPVVNNTYRHSYPNLPVSKSYKVRLKAYSGAGCFADTIVTITVNGSPQVSFSSIPGICQEGQPRLVTQGRETAGVAGSGWYAGTGISSNGNFDPSVSGSGTFPITYYYKSNGGCTDSATQNITVWNTPLAKWSTSAAVCEGKSVQFQDQSVTNSGKTNFWVWDFGDGTKDATSVSSYSKTYKAAGTYNVSLKVRTDSGCQSQLTTQPVIVYYLPVVDFTLPKICLPDGNGTFNDSSTIADNTENSFKYLWNFGDPNDNTTSTQKNGTHKFSGSGPYNVQLSVTSKDGCVATANKQLATIYDAPLANFSFTPSEACLGANFMFIDASNGVSGNIINWKWDLGDGTSDTAKNTSRKYTSANNYRVSLTITNDKGCVSIPTTKTVIVNPYPVVNAGPDLVALEGGSLQLNPQVSGNQLSFLWTPSLYLSNPTTQNPVSTPLASITYKLTVTGKGGCTSSDDVAIKLVTDFSIPNAFSPNNDGINDVWNIEYLYTYPNATVEVFNRYGQKVFNSVGYAKPWDGKVNGVVLPAGVYYYIINPKNGRKPYSGSLTLLR